MYFMIFFYIFRIAVIFTSFEINHTVIANPSRPPRQLETRLKLPQASMRIEFLKEFLLQFNVTKP